MLFSERNKMRKLLPKILICLLVIGIFNPMVKVNAQEAGEVGTCYIANGEGEPTPTAATKAQCDVEGGTWFKNTELPKGETAGTVSIESDTCGLLHLQKCLDTALAAIAYIIMSLISLLLYLSGMLLNFVLEQTITNMSVNMQGMTGINIGWKVIRDLMNIAFIFLLVFYAIKVIIGRDTRESVGKFIVGIVMASILINFSLFFTKVLIDASNIVTVGFYNSIVVVDGTNASNYGLSGRIVDKLGLNTFWKAGGLSEFKTNAYGDAKSITIVGIAGSILMIVATFVFLAISAMFIIRYLALILLLMLSPVGYMGLALPGMQKYAKDWWDTLTGQLLFAPIYMLMTWLVMTLLSTPLFGTAGKDANYASLLLGQDGKSTPDSVGLLMNFAIIIGLMIATLTVSKQFASKGNKMIGQATGKLTAFAGGAVLGNAASAGRNTIGRFGKYVANSEKIGERLKDRASQGGVGGFFAKQTLKVSDGAAQSSFDVRSVKPVGNLTKSLGIDLGKGADAKKVNFRKELEEKGEKEQKFAKVLSFNDEKKKQITAEIKRERNYDNLSKKDKKDVDKDIDEAVNKRIYDYSKTFSDESGGAKARRYVENAFKIGTSALAGSFIGGVAETIGGALVGGTAFRITTKGDKKAIAKQIRKATGKSKDQQFAELAKEIANESKEDEEKGEKEEKTPPSGGTSTAGGTGASDTAYTNI
jgi:hypothetical protein